MGCTKSVPSKTIDPNESPIKKWKPMPQIVWCFQDSVVDDFVRDTVNMAWDIVMSGNSEPFREALKKQPDLTPNVFFYNLLFDSLLNLNPAARGLFKGGVAASARMMSHVIKFVVTIQETGPAFDKTLKRLAVDHNKRGIKVLQFAHLGLVFLHSVRFIIGDENYTPEIKYAFTVKYSRMMQVMLSVVESGQKEYDASMEIKEDEKPKKSEHAPASASPSTAASADRLSSATSASVSRMSAHDGHHHAPKMNMMMDISNSSLGFGGNTMKSFGLVEDKKRSPHGSPRHHQSHGAKESSRATTSFSPLSSGPSHFGDVHSHSRKNSHNEVHISRRNSNPRIESSPNATGDLTAPAPPTPTDQSRSLSTAETSSSTPPSPKTPTRTSKFGSKVESEATQRENKAKRLSQKSLSYMTGSSPPSRLREAPASAIDSSSAGPSSTPMAPRSLHPSSSVDGPSSAPTDVRNLSPSSSVAGNASASAQRTPTAVSSAMHSRAKRITEHLSGSDDKPGPDSAGASEAAIPSVAVSQTVTIRLKPAQSTNPTAAALCDKLASLESLPTNKVEEAGPCKVDDIECDVGEAAETAQANALSTIPEDHSSIANLA